MAATLGKSVTSREDFLRALFQRFDSNRDEEISAEEMSSTLQGFNVSEADVAAVLATHDTNHNGQLDWQEFKHFMQNCCIGSLQVGGHRPRAASAGCECLMQGLTSRSGPEDPERWACNLCAGGGAAAAAQL